MKPIPVIAVFDVGKTNKKLFLFDENYRIVFERSARFLETEDEDGDPCENLESLRLAVFDSLHEVFRKPQFEVKAINFSSYGASFVYLDEDGRPLTPLYNYLKNYPDALAQKIYDQYGGEETFSKETASPALGSLNSGLQLYRIKEEKPDIFKKIKYALHLPQYLSFLLSGQYYADRTSIGCHTTLWNFKDNGYHRWVSRDGVIDKMAPICNSDEVFKSAFPGSPYVIGTGLHDSSAALIPYLFNFQDPFILISTGTWSISFNPFNHSELTLEELRADCLFYLSYKGTPVKASRLFAGYEHELQSKRIATHFQVSTAKFRTVTTNWKTIKQLKSVDAVKSFSIKTFSERDLSIFEDYETAYHQLIMDIVEVQYIATKRVMDETNIHRIFVDGGFSKNPIYMSLLSEKFEHQEVFAASMAQATAIGTALSIHRHWNSNPIPNDLIELKFYAKNNFKTVS
ncbi:carbohydrate kinase, FGGY family protein [Sphingobacterium spiritivorum ATCC 33300]|uniref:Rhamnulokinase n=2 Tax=Sphingobacterium spiritivorum TaxID=258 RepID=A0A380B886_SPHSI|nr:FGGY family carbohydrate kinase [Sphingobacterium spiritivorum]EEI92562.1 carbohydrate kinase, FGGY family protein [Sphingobacterium spiritivorum ATCC 33300]QQS94065.1 carbohydrate kinase [Sphingobacterium spiritivorum]SUI96645.1 rhamnulokinase [Sphingobacterium spiritivorum]